MFQKTSELIEKFQEDPQDAKNIASILLEICQSLPSPEKFQQNDLGNKALEVLNSMNM